MQGDVIDVHIVGEGQQILVDRRPADIELFAQFIDAAVVIGGKLHADEGVLRAAGDARQRFVSFAYIFQDAQLLAVRTVDPYADAGLLDQLQLVAFQPFIDQLKIVSYGLIGYGQLFTDAVDGGYTFPGSTILQQFS